MHERAWPPVLVDEVPQRLCPLRRGTVQGGGCCPLLGRLTRALGLTGWVRRQGRCREVRGEPRRERRCRRRPRQWRLVALGLLALVMLGAPLLPQTARPVVYVVPIAGMIDLGLAPFAQRVLHEATDAGAAAVILEINTFGGRVDAAVLIRDALLQAKVPTVAFVNKRAISAGALISLAAEKIVMAEGGTIGAATPVTMGEPGGPAQPVAEKTVSYMRKEFRSTAEARKRPPLLAEAMVDADVEVPGVSEKGKLLTLTTE